MKKIYSVEEYIEEHAHFSEALIMLRDIINTTECIETIKWSAPVYTINGKNVLGLGAFKNHFGIWFFNGVFLKDEYNLLVNAQESKTKALRQMRFESITEIDKHIVLAYVKEAIENQKLGKEIKPDRSKKETVIPKELKDLFTKNTDLKNSFETLSPYKQREYCNYIDSAKREATKQTRLEKIIPMILQNIGLNDKYKNC
ncbi:YdeI/OmpD-associated family protein [Flavivirga amylovorans]|uniref:YdeI/OmpD-associated family protein n=1 Tax=Flavivirga amylovorans TaxID=870486 RepID=A0ABT8WXU7_9FLAO|nr:YdeI/OmpD-associated family protein [Flavivirga amylovorans]MDO5986303.1 YdeI/OmpD-associated family protein [Flavivirga amylovorans]